jgi:putative phosphoribosyl transferase
MREMGSETVRLAVNEVTVEGNLMIPAGAQGLVLFAHGSGSSRHSPRNQHVAKVLSEAGIATLLFDLLTAEEEAEDLITGHLRFDIPMLAERVSGATNWVARDARTAGLRRGYFGASTGAAAALVAAAERDDIAALVSRGGRPDLAGGALPNVKAPTLLIVGGRDTYVIELNQMAMRQMRAPRELKIIPGASHLFEERGALEQVAAAAAEWFGRYLGEEERREAA